MKAFLDHNFLLNNRPAETLYHSHAAAMPIIDYHCHLPVEQIAANKSFDNLTQIWLNGDHYKWRAMRTYGIKEKYITGEASDFEKFQKWAETVPHTIRNPLYHWTHLELKRVFGVEQLLNPSTAAEIYEVCNQQLTSGSLRVHDILGKMKVEVICTTDDPVDNLEHHQAIKRQNLDIKVLPTFRPDKAMAVEDVLAFNQYLDQLEVASNRDISNFMQLVDALQQRHEYFHENGCCLSDHGLETLYAEPSTVEQAGAIFKKLRQEKQVSIADQNLYKSALLVILAEMDQTKGWVQQFHLGALRNNNSRRQKKLGPDAGFDSIGDLEIARPLSRFLDKLDAEQKLAKTIIYNLNPRDNEVIATMIGNFNDGSVKGRMQYGSAWWFLDQKDGMEKQLNALSNMGLLSCFIGMLTDSRSFLSYPRHEYFRRILCNLIGTDVENGELPNDMELLAGIVQNICYYNAKEYFNF